jgi:hypothetical protein
MNLTTHLHLVLKLRVSAALFLPSPVCLHGMDRDNFTFYDYLLLWDSVFPFGR